MEARARETMLLWHRPRKTGFFLGRVITPPSHQGQETCVPSLAGLLPVVYQ